MPRSNPQNTVKALRAEAKAAYARGKGNRALKGYNKMPKHALLRALGRTEEAKAELKKSRSVTSTKTASAVAAHLEGNSATRKAQIKGRLLRAVKREINKARKANPNIAQEKLRKIAGLAFASEVKAIRKGLAEDKPKRGGFKKGRSHSYNPAADELFPPPPDFRAIGAKPIPASFKTVAEQNTSSKERKDELERVKGLLKKVYKRVEALYAKEKELRFRGPNPKEIAKVQTRRRKLLRLAGKLEDHREELHRMRNIKGDLAPGVDFGRGKKLNMYKHRAPLTGYQWER